MANAWDSGLDREAMLRRVAIVLSSLPATVAANLLGEIDADTKLAVRRTMMSLADVDPLEQKRALHAFKISVQKPGASRNQLPTPEKNKPVLTAGATEPAAENSSRVIRSSAVQGEPNRGMNSGIPVNDDDHPLAFLEQVDEQGLANLLKRERPQVVATVLASIRPDHAARVLPHLGSSLEDMLGRIGKIETIPRDSLIELADHFRKSLETRAADFSDTLGRRALDAILAAMPAEQEPDRAKSASTLGRTAVRTGSFGTTPGDADSTQPGHFPSAGQAVENLTSRLRIAEGTSWQAVGEYSPSGNQRKHQRGEASLVSRNTTTDAPVPAASKHTDTAEQTVPFPSTDSIHQHLVEMSPQHLCETLGRVQGRVAMLALCGLPNQVTSAVLALLPKAESRKVRESMNSLGALQLREIDEAKEIVAVESLEVIDEPVSTAA